jgi:hypothetical protein
MLLILGGSAAENPGEMNPVIPCGIKATWFLVRFKGSNLNPQFVIAPSVEIHGEHLVFLRSDGNLAALFVLEIVESWPEVDFSGP